MRKFRKNLGQNLKHLRGEHTQAVFAKKLGISQASLNRMENRIQNVSLDTLELICQRLKKKPAELLEEKAEI